MNRLVLIGNGFDLAHKLPTSYQDFINWYWDGRFNFLRKKFTAVSKEKLCELTVTVSPTWYNFFEQGPSILNEYKGAELFLELRQRGICRATMTPLFERIHKSFETKGWVDIENDYYELLKNYVLENAPEEQIDVLNEELHDLQDLLVKYLKSIKIAESLIKKEIIRYMYMPFKSSEISIEGQYALQEHIESWMEADDNDWDRKFYQYGYDFYSKGRVIDFKERTEKIGYSLDDNNIPLELLLPNQIMLLNFNYTHTADLYCKEASIFTINQIHGDLDNPKSVIFGYGDELDMDYKTILEKNENKYLGNIKSIKYLEADNYRNILSFIESEPYQILIMGHSCGNSDCTLLNTLFEHKNCVSIKPYYRKEKDNYIELVQNISRNFTDMKLMRDRVVNKTYCEPLTY